ncbi:hypothetical protein CONLIGDRAFT_678013 [Coniochaeta ligniaria NRRL 30616]|uniref:Uncharacterized protein n=1 Tax=Coniochaeta ligniaria NRRL 30616 TaxID=1408157 RepID=A0A1J7JUW5_9PEZI|nr:hypothetical protein CONLIGDRAFT_678013 [Coniochaeta ligniaria NRRL 30616]
MDVRDPPSRDMPTNLNITVNANDGSTSNIDLNINTGNNTTTATRADRGADNLDVVNRIDDGREINRRPDENAMDRMDDELNRLVNERNLLNFHLNALRAQVNALRARQGRNEPPPYAAQHHQHAMHPNPQPVIQPNPHPFRLPEHFYRVQTRESPTIRHKDGTLESRMRYDAVDDVSHFSLDPVGHGPQSVPEWLYKIDTAALRLGTIELDIINTPTARPSHVKLPVWTGYDGCVFLSLSDARHSLGVSPRLDDAVDWARLCMFRGRRDVYILRISTAGLQPGYLYLDAPNSMIQLPIWSNDLTLAHHNDISPSAPSLTLWGAEPDVHIGDWEPYDHIGDRTWEPYDHTSHVLGLLGLPAVPDGGARDDTEDLIAATESLTISADNRVAASQPRDNIEDLKMLDRTRAGETTPRCPSGRMGEKEGSDKDLLSEGSQQAIRRLSEITGRGRNKKNCSTCQVEETARSIELRTRSMAD